MNKASCVIDTITHVIVAFVRGFLVNDSKAHYLRGRRDINAFGFPDCAWRTDDGARVLWYA